MTPSSFSNPAMPPIDGKGFALRLALFYGALFIIYGIHVPYFPVWLDARGLTPSEIAWVTSAPFFIRLLTTPTAALFADMHGLHREVVIASSLMALVLALALTVAGGFWSVALLAIPFALATSTVMPLTETLAMSGVRAGGVDYGRMRLWGSLAFIAVGLVGGALLDVLGPASVIWIIVVGAIATAIAAVQLPRTIAEPGEGRPKRFVAEEARALVTSPVFLLFLAASGAVQGAHATFYAFGAIHWRSQGLAAVSVGLLWAIAVGVEVAVFAWSGTLAARLGPIRLLIGGAMAAVLRWAAMSFDPPFAALVPLQALHGLTYGGTHIAAMHFISRAVSRTAAGTAQALYATMAAGVVMGAATLVSGPLYAAFAGRAYLAPALLALAGLAAAAALARLWDGGVIAASRAKAAATPPQGSA